MSDVRQTFDRRISLGNILTVVAMLIAGVGTFYAQTVKMEALSGEIAVQAARLEAMEGETKRRRESIEEKWDRLLFERR